MLTACQLSKKTTKQNKTENKQRTNIKRKFDKTDKQINRVFVKIQTKLLL